MEETRNFLRQYPPTQIAVILMTALMVSKTDCSSIKRQHSKHQQHSSNGVTLSDSVEPSWRQRSEDGALFPVTPVSVAKKLTEYSGSRVAFSVSTPVLPPSEGEFSSNKNTIKNKRLQRRKLRKNGKKSKRTKKRKQRKRLGRRKYRHKHNNRKARTRRSHGRRRMYSVHPISSCNSISEWTQMNETLTSNGNVVTVLPYILMDGKRHIQYIYQTMCLDEGHACTGIDNSMYRSECKTKRTYAFAYVRNSFGEESWSQIEVKGSCNCALYRKLGSGPVSILDTLGLS